MDAQQLLTAPLLDIIFEGKNKEYGAYLLRKNYRQRLSAAIVITTVIICLSLGCYYLFGTFTSSPAQFIIPDNTLIDFIEPEPPSPVVQPPPPAAPLTRSIRFAGPPAIVADDRINPDEKPPQMDQLEKASINVFNRDGKEDTGLPPPPGTSQGVIADIRSTRAEEDNTFVPVEVESAYPGGMEAWKRFLVRTLDYPAIARDQLVQGTVLVRFIVDVDGRLSEIEAISGPEELRNEAVRVIGRSGRWTPAMQNGRQVKSYKKQAIVFQLGEE